MPDMNRTSTESLNAMSDQPNFWPALPFDSWSDTCATLHMWTQMVGKVRLALTPLLNHWWNVPLWFDIRFSSFAALDVRATS